MLTPSRRRRRRIAQEANHLKLDTDIKTKNFMKLQVAKDEHKNTQIYIYKFRDYMYQSISKHLISQRSSCQRSLKTSWQAAAAAAAAITNALEKMDVADRAESSLSLRRNQPPVQLTVCQQLFTQLTFGSCVRAKLQLSSTQYYSSMKLVCEASTTVHEQSQVSISLPVSLSGRHYPVGS